MRKYVRRITKRKGNTFSHMITVPAKFVKELGLSDSLVELKIRDNSIVIKKIGNTLDGANPIEDEEDENVTIHH